MENCSNGYGQYDEEIENYKKCIELNPKDISALMFLGSIYNGDFDDNSNSGTYDVNYYADRAKAYQYFKKCIQVDPHLSEAHLRLARIQLSFNDVKAIQYFQNYLHLNPKDLKAIYQLGLACQHFKRNEDAVIYFNKCIQMDKKNSKAFKQLGISYGELEKPKEAIKSLKKCVQINNADTQAFACLGRIYDKLGKVEEAICYYKKCNYLSGNVEAKQYLIKHGQKDLRH